MPRQTTRRTSTPAVPAWTAPSSAAHAALPTLQQMRSIPTLEMTPWTVTVCRDDDNAQGLVLVIKDRRNFAAQYESVGNHTTRIEHGYLNKFYTGKDVVVPLASQVRAVRARLAYLTAATRQRRFSIDQNVLDAFNALAAEHGVEPLTIAAA